MADSERIVRVKVQVVPDPANPKTLKGVTKSVVDAHQKAEKEVLKSQAAIAKGAKKQADAEEREAKRVGKAAEKLLANKARFVAKAHKEELALGKKMAGEKIRLLDRTSKEEERAARKRVADQNRATIAILRDREREGREKERITQRGAREADRATKKREADEKRAADKIIRERKRVLTFVDRHAAKLRELKTLLDNGTISQGLYTQAVRKSKEQMQLAATAGQRAFGRQMLSGLTSITSALGITGGLAGGVMLLRKEYQKLIDVQRRAKEVSMTTADAEAQALINLGATTAAQRDAYLSRVQQMSKDTGLTTRGLHLAMSSALSARGELPESAAFEAVRASARIAPHSQQAMTTLAGAALDIKNIGGAGVTAEAGLGYLVNLQALSRMTQLENVAQHGMPAIQAGVSRGATLPESAALYAAITQGMKEWSGRRSATGMITFTERLQKDLPQLAQQRLTDVKEKIALGQESPKFLQQELRVSRAQLTAAEFEAGRPLTPQEQARQAKLSPTQRQRRKEERQLDLMERRRDVTDRQAELRTLTEAKGRLPELERLLPGLERQLATATGGTFGERLSLVQTTPGLREKFMERPFQKKSQASMEQLVMGGGVARTYAQFLERLPGVEETAPMFRKRVAVQRGSELQQTANFVRSIKATGERIAILDQPSARIGAIYDEYKPIMEAIGAGRTSTQFQAMMARRGGPEGFARQLETAQRGLEQPWEPGVMTGPFTSTVGAPREPTSIERGQAAEVSNLIESIRGLVELTKTSQATGESVDVVNAIEDQTDRLEAAFEGRSDGNAQAALQVAPRGPGLPAGVGGRP